MATTVPGSSAQSETFANDLAGMGSFFIDPQSAARRVFHKWFWIGPLVIFSIVSVIASYLMLPMVQHVLEVSPIPPGSSPEQYQRGMEIGMTIQRISMYFSPAIVAAILALQALVIWATCSVLAKEAKFRWLFNLVAGCSLIQVLASIASLAVLKGKGEVSTMAELHPALGLDIFLPEGTNKYAMAFLGYFSIFEIWWIVMMVLVFSAAFRVSKAKALAAVLPLIVVNILLRIGGAFFQR
jgi:Yip1 domain